MRVRALAERISRSVSNFYKALDGRNTLRLEHLLLALDLIEVDPGDFFARALGTDSSSAALLAALEPLGTVHSRMKRLEKTLRTLETAPIRSESPRDSDAEALVAKLVTCAGKEQRRRIATAERYRDPAVVHRYLEHLDALRYDQPKQAVLNAEAVAVRLVPHLRGSRQERLALAVKALTIYGSAHRQIGGFATAARAMRVALRSSQRNQLSGLLADILQRGAYVLGDHGRFLEAMKLLDEALVINFDSGYDLGVGMVLVDRGYILNHMGTHEKAVGAFEKGLPYLEVAGIKAQRNRLAAYANLAVAYEHLGQLQRAERILSKALAISSKHDGINKAKLTWQFGNLKMAKTSYKEAEQYFREASNLLEQREVPDRALVALDLTRALLAQGQVEESRQVAFAAAKLLKPLQRNKVYSAVLTEFLRLAVADQLSINRVNRLRAQILESMPVQKTF